MITIRTANLEILEVWLLGGQINICGSYWDGFNDFRESILSEEVIKEIIQELIEGYGNAKFYYYGAYYKFKEPNEKNLNKLVKLIKNCLEK